MFTIGEFATIGRVSARMLRHYDAIGLLTPIEVEASTGYRYYSAAQLRRLNRLLALKDLGFTLHEVGRLLGAEQAGAAVDAGELRGMLRLRRAELARAIAADQDRLDRVEARLRVIEGENAMSNHPVTTSAGPGAHLAQLSAVAAGDSSEIGPVVQGLYQDLQAQLARAGVMISGPAVAHYETLPDGTLHCHAGVTVAESVTSVGTLEVVDLPGLAQAATVVYEGPMSGIGEAYQRLAVWIEDNGYRTDGTARETYLVTHPRPQQEWVTEVRMPVFTAGT